jgi:hypothetical protein
MHARVRGLLKSGGLASAVVGLTLTALDTLVLGIPSAILVVEKVRGGQFPSHGPWFETVVYLSVASWLALLVIWLAVGHLNPRRARVAWYCLLGSLAAMLVVLLRPEIQ